MKNQPEINNLNVIVADVDWETFEEFSKLKNSCNFINLSSDFAVNFILDYEQIDVLIISRKISNSEELVKKALKKKANSYIIGKDIKYPLDLEEIEKTLQKEIEKKINHGHDRKYGNINKFINSIFNVKKNKNSISLNGSDRKKISRKKTINTDLKKPEDFIKNKGVEELDGFREIDEVKVIGSEIKETNSVTGYINDLKINELKDENININHYGNTNLLKNELKNILKNNLENTTPGISSFSNIKAVKQKIIIFMKAKGGVGSTTLSLFLAYIMRKMKTLLIDLNFSEGGSDIGYYLNIPKTPNMVAFTEGYNRNAMENSIINFVDNLDILQAPPTYELSKKIDLQDIYSLVDVAKRKYHLIIFDLPNQINEMCLGVIDLSDLVIMVTDYTIGSISRLIGINNRFLYSDLDKILVLNRNKNGNGLDFSKNQLQRFFNLKELVFLSEDANLNGKTDFVDFNFENLKNFEVFTNKVLEMLTCDY